MLILFRSKVAFVGLFFSVLQKYFQLSLLLMRSLTILGTAKLRLLGLLSIGFKNWGISSDIFLTLIPSGIACINSIIFHLKLFPILLLLESQE